MLSLARAAAAARGSIGISSANRSSWMMAGAAIATQASPNNQMSNPFSTNNNTNNAQPQQQQRLRRRLPQSRTSANTNTSATKFVNVYVHHTSKQILQYLQDHQSNWLHSTGLYNGLQIEKNGTFTLYFPNSNSNNRIWTSYEPSTKQHWINIIYNTTFQKRFLLKDHNNHHKIIHDNSMDEKHVHAVIRSMIQAFNEHHHA
mmetsp:Transcript_11003/g.31590  ORF Transcript_11003/g.31590 Transcript_11003/m.31590 type:complete len:202 (-) Transcript_11003:76-681(-)